MAAKKHTTPKPEAIEVLADLTIDPSTLGTKELIERFEHLGTAVEGIPHLRDAHHDTAVAIGDRMKRKNISRLTIGGVVHEAKAMVGTTSHKATPVKVAGERKPRVAKTPPVDASALDD